MVISQRLHIKLRDVSRTIAIQAGDFLIPYLGVDTAFITYPRFVITEINRDEKTNQLSITAYDLIDDLKNHTVADMNISKPYTLGQFMTALATYAGTTYTVVNIENMYPFNLNYIDGANFEGTETVKEALQAIAEATQTVVYVNNSNQIVLKRLAPTDTVQLNITKSLYYDLSSKTNRRLVGIAHITELGDNVEATLEVSGTIQQVRNNPFWDMRDDIGTVVQNALAAVGGLTINQFSCSWLGNLFLEIGDKISLTTKDNQTVESYVLDDVITYDGSLREKTQWNYTEEDIAHTNSASIGDLLKQTYARVDKQQKTIELMVSDISNTHSSMANLLLTTQDITATVSNYQTNVDNQLDSLNGSIQEIRNQVQATMTDEQIRIAISEAVENAVSQVSTETGFTFDKDGLHISKTGSEMSTTIDEDGMDITKSGVGILTADSNGVNAINLTARQYLVIGTHSRFEDYGYDRTGCFWIG